MCLSFLHFLAHEGLSNQLLPCILCVYVHVCVCTRAYMCAVWYLCVSVCIEWGEPIVGMKSKIKYYSSESGI